MIDAVLLLGVWSLPPPVRMAIAALVAHHYFLAADAERREGEVSPLGLSLMDIIFCVVVLMNTLASFSDLPSMKGEEHAQLVVFSGFSVSGERHSRFKSHPSNCHGYLHTPPLDHKLRHTKLL